MRVPILDPIKGNQKIQSKLEEAALRVLRSGKFILGKEVESLEREITHRGNPFLLDAKYALAVSSGTDALLLALMVHGIGPGDEIICPTFTFFATAGVIDRVGATPVFVDIEYDTFNIDPTKISEAITERTKAIIPVHLFGQCANMPAIMAIAEQNNLVVIEDACQSIGAFFWDDDKFIEKKAGSWGNAGCFSFFPSKNLGGFGEGGLVVTNDFELYKKMKMLRVHGCTHQYYHDYVGGNFRMDELQAALLRVKLTRLRDDTFTRINHAKMYDKALVDNMYILPQKQVGTVWNQYTIRVPEGVYDETGIRDKLREYLASHGIATGIYYPLPLHQQPCFKKYGHDYSLPVAEEACKECLSLPIAAELSELQIDYVIARLQVFENSL